MTAFSTLVRLLNPFDGKIDSIMATLADIKTQLDTLQTAEQKLEALAVSQQTDLAALKIQLAAAQAAAQAAGSADPAALQAIADEITAMQAGIAAALPAAPVVAALPGGGTTTGTTTG